MNNNYDVILICFTDPRFDARTINLAKTLLKYNRKVALITPDYDTQPSYINNSDYFPIKVNLDNRVKNSVKEFTKGVKKFKLTADYVHAADFYSLPAAKNIKMKCGAKLTYDSREIYSQLNSLRNRPLTKKLVELKEKYLVTYVDRIIVTAKEDEIYLKKHFRHSIPYSIIKNLPSSRERISSNLLKDEFKIPEENLILLYQGWVLEGRGLDKVINSIKKLKNITLVIIGNGEYLDSLKKLVSNSNLDENVIFTGLISYDKLYEYTSSADVGLVLFENTSISYQNALPNKLFEFIQAGLPVISSNQDTITSIVEINEIGIVLDDLKENNIINSIKNLKSEEKRMKYSENIDKIRSDYSYETQELEILKVFA